MKFGQILGIVSLGMFAFFGCEGDNSITVDIIEKDIQLDENMFPEEIKKSKNFDNVLSLVRGLNNYCVEKFITNSSNASDLIGYYNKNIDYLKCSTLSCISS